LKRFILCLALSAGILSSCSDSPTSTTRAELRGTYDVTLSGSYLFVTSSDENQLRVVELEASPRDFVKAPNPLEPLAIPVLQRPSNLTRDESYTETGEQGEPGPYIYARSFGSREISVVAAHPDFFVERHRISAGGLVTAFAARTGGSLGGSVLYYAEQAGPDARLFRVELPKPEELSMDFMVTRTPLSLDLTGRMVTALLVLPGQERLVIATRGTMGTAGETFRVAIDGDMATREVTYDFGSPVRLLATHPRAEVPQDTWFECSFDPERRDPASKEAIPPEPLRAGQYVFGVLDESSCGAQQACSGVVAVDAVTGVRAKDPTGLPMLPIAVGGALPTGLTLATEVDVKLPCVTETPQFNQETQQIDLVTRNVPLVKRPLVGIVPTSNGTITLFDGVSMRTFDLDAEKAASTTILVNSAGVTKVDEARTLAQYLDVVVAEGVTQTDTFRIVYQRALPALAALQREFCPAGGTSCSFTVNAEPAAQVEVEDVVVLVGSTGTCKDARGNDLDLVIRQKVTAGSSTQLVTDPIPLGSECESLERFPNFTVRAAGPRPFVVISNGRGYLGRIGAGQTFEIAASYYYRPDPPSPLDPAPKEIRITPSTQGASSEVIARGDEYTVTTISHFRPYIFGVDTSSAFVGLAAYRLPGPVVYTRVGEVDLAYIAYPSADGILQVALEAITENALNTTGLVPFE
jgi:hypothetical protein